MPFRKKRTSVRFLGFGKKSESKAEASAARFAAATLRRAGAVNLASRGLQLNEGEFKAVDAAGSSVIDTTGAVNLLNGIARGDEIGERNGREVVMRSIEFHARVSPTITTGKAQQGRLLLVYDRQTNAAPLTGAQVLDVFNTISPRNLENRRRFKILMDRRLVLENSGQAGEYKQVNFYRRLRHPVTFNSGDAATVADITTGSVYLVTIGSNVAGATAGAAAFDCRIRYQDK